MKRILSASAQSLQGIMRPLITTLIIISVFFTLPGCSNEKEPVAITITPKPDSIKYKYTIENISDETLYTFNNDTSNPNENYAEVKVSAGGKIIVQALSPTKITPMIRSDKQGLQTEFVYNFQTEVYQINGYMNLFEAAITGDASLVSIYFPNPATGKADSLINVKLPQVLTYRTYQTQNIEIIVSKEVVDGIITLATKIKGKNDFTKSTNASQGVITSTTDLTKKTSVVTIIEPVSVTPPTVPNPANPSSPSSPSVPTNPSTPTQPSSCGMYNGKPVYTGPKGGCYYINGNGNKTYVARSFCC